MSSKRQWRLLAVVVLLLALGLAINTGTANAQENNPWLALYWDNINLEGDPVLERLEPSVTHRWGTGSPAPAISPDRFSARWTNNLELDAGTYRFTTVSDDGIRVWVDGEQIIDNWTVHPEAVNTAVVDLSTGVHPVRVDYFENTGEAIAVLTWEQVDQPDDDPGEETISISPLQGPPGTIINVRATGFSANVPVTVGLGVANAEPSLEKEVVTDASGTLETTITVPQDAEPGRIWRVLAIRDGESALSGDFTVTTDEPANVCGNVYIVRPGDWLARIARRCNTTVEALLAANPTITNPNIVSVGQRLILPGGSDPAAPAVDINPSSGPVGTTVMVDASGFAPNVEATVTFGPRDGAAVLSETAATNQLGALETSFQVPAVANTGESWVVQVGAAGKSAVSGAFTVTQGAVTATTDVNLRLRGGPGIQTEILDVVPAGTTLEVMGIGPARDWIRATYQGQTGWLSRSFVTISGDLSQVPVTGRFDTTNIYLIALGDAGASGPEIGCDDSVVPVQIEIEPTQAPLTAALQRLLAIDERLYGQSGLYNALYQSNLTVREVAITDSTATIRLTGELNIGGACDAPRVEAQLRWTALQYETVDDVNIFINGQPLEQVLSGA